MKRVVTLLVLLVALAGCVSPAWDDHDYALKAQASAESVSSTVRIVRVAVQDSGRLTRPYLKTVLTEAAGDLDAVADRFGGVQPPSERSDQVRDRLLDRIQRAEDVVDDLLIQVRRNGIEDPARAVRELEAVG
ncbi:MAG: hypothetical protein HOV96_02325 [Nonomuraea sp.]|nr:hypothetical protein [Nonomuraea sp.]NUP66982.1 hypothetical protein [Nonomuraea sp.]NUP76368.1 hypothetical protein [Nonomuraea sp.]